jgi:4-amino-4-deoxy-L-arabinose transferase-like glycosyltransferase
LASMSELPAAPWSRLLSPATGLLAILLLTVVLYAPSLHDWFLADDFWFLRDSQTTGWGTWLAQSFDYRDPRPVPEFNEYRPLYLVTFRAEYSLFGLNAVGYHAVNVAVHLAAVVLLWFVARRLTQRTWAAHLASLIFALHFAYGDAVKWVVNGNTPMATALYLLAFLLFMKYTDAGPKRFWYYAGFLLSFVGALLYHQVTVPLSVVLPAWYFLLRRRPMDALRPASWLPFVPLALVMIPYVAVNAWVREHYAYLAGGFQFGRHMYDNYVGYLSMSVYPTAGKSSLWPHIAVITLLLSGALLTQWRWSWLSVFAVFWFYTALAPDSVLIFGAFGRLLYLPGAALAILMTTAAMRLVDLASSELPKALLRPLRQAAPVLALLAALAAAMLLIKACSITASHYPQPDNTISKQAAANHALIDELRAAIPTIPSDGVLYVANPPFNLVIFNDEPLDNMVELYYGEVEVKSVPLKEPPFWNLAHMRAALRPQDRLFVFERGK